MMLQLIAEQLDIDLDELKANRPKPEDEPLFAAKTALQTIIPEDDPPEGDVSA